MSSEPGSGPDRDGWQPPTESEMKVLQARRERSDKISKLMGDYLLKGYKMLGSCCDICDTILLQDTRGNNYCIACQELDADNVKDDPALSEQAALRQVEEESQKLSASSSLLDRRDKPSAEATRQEIPAADLGSSEGGARQRHAQQDFLPPDLTRGTPQEEQFSFPTQESCSLWPKSVTMLAQESRSAALSTRGDRVTGEALCILHKKMQQATAELRESTNVNMNISLCQLIKHSAEAIEALHKIQKQN